MDEGAPLDQVIEGDHPPAGRLIPLQRAAGDRGFKQQGIGRDHNGAIVLDKTDGALQIRFKIDVEGLLPGQKVSQLLCDEVGEFVAGTHDADGGLLGQGGDADDGVAGRGHGHLEQLDAAARQALGDLAVMGHGGQHQIKIGQQGLGVVIQNNTLHQKDGDGDARDIQQLFFEDGQGFRVAIHHSHPHQPVGPLPLGQADAQHGLDLLDGEIPQIQLGNGIIHQLHGNAPALAVEHVPVVVHIAAAALDHFDDIVVGQLPVGLFHSAPGHPQLGCQFPLCGQPVPRLQLPRLDPRQDLFHQLAVNGAAGVDLKLHGASPLELV